MNKLLPPPLINALVIPVTYVGKKHSIIPILRQGSEKLRGKIKPNEESAKIDPKIEDNVRQIKTATGTRLLPLMLVFVFVVPYCHIYDFDKLRETYY